jgi:hypothetical protein
MCGFFMSSDQYLNYVFVLVYALGVTALWNLPVLNYILWPFKIQTVALHEFGHAVVGLMTGAKIVSITLSPDEGGLTVMKGGNPYLVLPAGYCGSTIWGALMVYAGFNPTAARIVTVLSMLCMAVTIYWSKNRLAAAICGMFVVVSAIAWIFAGRWLQYYIMFFGVMSSLYSLWDIIDDVLSNRKNNSDAVFFSRMYLKGRFSPQFWCFALIQGVPVVYFLTGCAVSGSVFGGREWRVGL